jgi:cell division protein FtsB
MKEKLLKSVSIVLLAIAAILLPFVIFGDGGMPRVKRLQEQVERIREKNKAVEWETQELNREIQHFRRNPELVKQVAREELGYVTSDEIVFIVP